MEPEQRGAIFRTTDDGKAEFRLRMSGDGELRFSSELIRCSREDGRHTARSVDGAVIHRVVADVAIFSFRLG